jgi:arylsulfatase
LRNWSQFVDEPLDLKLAEKDRLGSKYHWNNYSTGWGHVGNTPLKWFKTYTHGGGIRDPLIVHWPARIQQGGEISSQFCHCADIVPTVLEAIGLEAPKMLNGLEQLPVDGSSLLHTFDEPHAAEGKRVQYFELMGHRGIWADGWKAVTNHVKGEDFDQDRWELYHVADDFSETEDLAARHPEKLQELVGLWWKEAERNHVLPLDDRDRERALFTYWNAPRTRWVYEQGMTRVTGYAAPAVGNRSYRISADIEIALQTEGVILAVGSRFGGFVLYIQNGKLVHEYIGPLRNWVLESPQPLSPGRHTVVFAFNKTADRSGRAALLCDGKEIAAEHMDGMWPLSPVGGGVFCGYDDGSPVSERYSCPYAFTGRIREVIVHARVEQTDDKGFANLVSLNED